MQSDAEGNVVNELVFQYTILSAVKAFDTIDGGYVLAEEVGQWVWENSIGQAHQCSRR